MKRLSTYQQMTFVDRKSFCSQHRDHMGWGWNQWSGDPQQVCNKITKHFSSYRILYLKLDIENGFTFGIGANFTLEIEILLELWFGVLLLRDHRSLKEFPVVGTGEWRWMTSVLPLHLPRRKTIPARFCSGYFLGSRRWDLNIHHPITSHRPPPTCLTLYACPPLIVFSAACLPCVVYLPLLSCYLLSACPLPYILYLDVIVAFICCCSRQMPSSPPPPFFFLHFRIYQMPSNATTLFERLHSPQMALAAAGG